MYISEETPAQTSERLKRVIKESTVKFFEDVYFFSDIPLSDFPCKLNQNALAFVRDDLIWSQLIPAGNADVESYAVFRFHFPEGIDNSGFVGWLATHLKQKFGTGIFVICGYNQNKGGVFDYWGCPRELSKAVFDEIVSLVK